MNIEYKRQNLENYMCVIFDTLDEEKIRGKEFEIKILENRIDGLLNCFVTYINKEKVFYYRISSLQKFSNFIKKKVLSLEEFKNIFLNMFEMLEKLKYFFLDINSIFLDIDYIYIDTIKFNLYFCYIPFYKNNFRKDLIYIFDFLIENEKDEDKLIFFYKIMSELKKGDINIEILKKIIKEEKRLNILNEKKSDTDKDLKVVYIEDDETDINKKDNFVFNIRNIFSKKNEKRNSELEEVEKIFEEDFEDDNEKENIYDEEFIENKIKNQEYEQTSLLLDIKKIKSRTLRCIGCSELNIDINYFPFIVGRQNHLCDYVLDREGVSRVHFKIEEIDKNYVLVDLNSRNGVSLNGYLLENEEYRILNIGDSIRVADLEYIFE